MRHEFDVTTDHFQVLLGDSERGPLVDTSDLWGDQPVAVLDHVPEVVGIGTVRYGGRTHVQIDIVSRPPPQQRGWTDRGSFKLRVPSGRLVIWAPETADVQEAPSVALAPGMYAGCVLARGLEAVTDEMATDGPDQYRIILWKVE